MTSTPPPEVDPKVPHLPCPVCEGPGLPASSFCIRRGPLWSEDDEGPCASCGVALVVREVCEDDEGEIYMEAREASDEDP